MFRSLSPLAVVASWVLMAVSSAAVAQHSDITFHYEGGQVSLVPNSGQAGTADGVWTGEWDVDGFFAQDTSQPGWASEAAAGHGIGAGDIVAYNVLDNLFFWDGDVFQTPAEGVQVRVENIGSPDTLITADSGAQPGNAVSPLANSLGQASSSGEFHQHGDYKLEPISPTPPYGAYGLSLSLTTSAVGVSDSAPFFLVFNFGLNDEGFATATDAFAALLEPGLEGDFNNDGSVDAADYTVWRDGLDGEYDAADYQLWRDNYGRRLDESEVSGAGQAPSPGGAALTCVMMAVLSPSRRKRF